MYVTAFILIVPALFQGILSLSVIKKGRRRAFLFFAAVAAGLVMSSYSVDFAVRDVMVIFGTGPLVQTLCTIQIVEAIAGIILTIMLSKRLLYGDNGTASLAGFFSLAPPVMLPVTLFLVQTAVVSAFNGISYGLLLFSVTLLSIGTAFVFSLGCRRLFGSVEVLLELKLMVYFFQAVAAMFVPIVGMADIPVSATPDTYVPEFLVAMLAMCLVILAGFFRTKFRKVR